MPGGGGSRGGGGMVDQIFSKKLVFEKKTAEKGSRGLGAHFPPPYPGGDPPAYPQDGSAKFGFFRKKTFEKKIQLGEKNDKKNIFPKSFPLLYFDSLRPTLAFSAVAFARYPFFEPW